MAKQSVEQKLDQVLEMLKLAMPDVLPAQTYRATLLEIEERTSRKGRKYWQYKFELAVIPGRYVWGNFVGEYKPHAHHSEIGAEYIIEVGIREWNDRRYNGVDAVLDHA